MPEFILDHGTRAAATQFRGLDAFTQGYIEAMFFTNTGTLDDDKLSSATTADLAADTWARIATDCQDFQRIAAPLLDAAYARENYSPEQAGRDFWFTRCGHGVGFWDRTHLAAGKLGDRLSALCGYGTDFSSVDVYSGDDGRVYLA